MSVFDEEGNLLEVRSIPHKSHRLTPALWEQLTAGPTYAQYPPYRASSFLGFCFYVD